MRSLILLAALSLVGCERFDPPPEPRIADSENGIMTRTPEDPIVLSFSEEYKQDTLRVKMVPAVFDAEGNLLDEQKPPKLEEFEATTLLAYDGARPDDYLATLGGTFTPDARGLVIDPQVTPSYSNPYLLLVEPGLEDLDGHATVPRIRLPFVYELPEGGPTKLPTGYYYFILNVDYVSTQIQAFAYLNVDADTGQWSGVFTNASRLEVLNSRPGCPSNCDGETPVCALVPSPQCVKPSLKQQVLAEFSDFVPEVDPPNGYIFPSEGFAQDQADGSIAFKTSPFLIDIVVGTGGVNVRAEGSKISAVFVESESEPGRLMATGSISVDVIKLNGTGADPTQGTLLAMSLTQAEVDQVEALGLPIPTEAP
jgi:hypothetical protein